MRPRLVFKETRDRDKTEGKRRDEMRRIRWSSAFEVLEPEGI